MSENLEWAVRIRMDQQAIGESFAVLIFLGDVPEDPKEWGLCPAFAGSHYALAGG